MSDKRFFVQRSLDDLKTDELLAYERDCRSTIARNRDETVRIEATITVLNEGKTKNAMSTFGGLGGLTLTLVAMPVFPPVAILSVGCGLTSLIGVEQTFARIARRKQLRNRLLDIENSDAFCVEEIARIRQELPKRKGRP